MTDIVERLRRFKTGCDKPECERMIFTPLVCEEAAAEIERLRAWNAEIALNAREFAAENEKLRAALEWIAETTLTQPGLMVEKARAALEGRT